MNEPTKPAREISCVAVYCASSRVCDPVFHEEASALGGALADANITIAYGGGAVGSMGALADGSLAKGGHVHGVLPRFMDDLEWGHPGITKLDIVEDMRERKHRMLMQADAVVALPGGCGTLEEVFEVITLKRLGLYLGPIILVNTRGYWDDFAKLMQRCADERFMDQRHSNMWTIVDGPEDVVQALQTAPEWTEESRDFASIGAEEIGNDGFRSRS